MERSLAEGLAHRTVYSFLSACLEDERIASALEKNYHHGDDVEIHNEIKKLAAYHAQQSQYYKDLLEQDGFLSEEHADSMLGAVSLSIDPGVGQANKVYWDISNYDEIVTFITETPAQAIQLYQALQAVKDVEIE